MDEMKQVSGIQEQTSYFFKDLTMEVEFVHGGSDYPKIIGINRGNTIWTLYPSTYLFWEWMQNP